MEIVLAALIFGGFLLAAAYFWFRAQKLKARAAQLEQELGAPLNSSAGQSTPTPLRPPAMTEDGEMLDASDMLDDFDDATRVATVSQEDLLAATKK